MSATISRDRIAYDRDIVAWSIEQAKLIRAGRFNELDLERIADEIEDVGKSEQRELISRMAVLITHLLKWAYQPGNRSSSWEGSIREQRKRIAKALKQTPSLKNTLENSDWLEDAWSDGLIKAMDETGISDLPESPVWTSEEMLTEGWLP